MQLITSPWADTFEGFARSIDRSTLVVSPFITSDPLRNLARWLRAPHNCQIVILTNLAIDSMLQGSTNPRALLEFAAAVPATTVRHLPGLHAKVYIADRSIAIITSANLTSGGIQGNYEYGIRITDENLVRLVAEDLTDYGALGAAISSVELAQLADTAEDLRERNARLLQSAATRLRAEFRERVAVARESLLSLRATSAESTNSIFSRTILFLLKKGPLTTQELHPLIRMIHPDLCDDSVDRVIQGVRFGKRWKHMVRNAQQSLKNQGVIRFNGTKWHMA